jgi:small GTP-binding protein
MNDIKIAIAGPSSSGKTSLFNLLAQKKEKTKPTIGPTFYKRKFQSGVKVKNLKIIDTSGNSKFKNVTRSFLKEINGGILVFDLSNQESFEKIKEWFHELKRNQKTQIILVGNKKDQKRKISEEIARAFSSQQRIQYFETNFTDKTQIEKILNFLLMKIYAHEVDILKKDIMKDSRIRMRLGNEIV